ncbi:MAG: nucleoside 2-deoxyribosyltransferase [Sediminibacterium sp.]
MQKAYLALSYQNRKNLQAEIEAIQKTLASFHIELFIFVDVYHFSTDEEKKMMQTAFNEIDASDFLIAEVSEKAIGVGIEIGYAVAKNKRIIYLRNDASEHSATAAGSSSNVLIYQDAKALAEKLAAILSPFKI